MPHNGHTEEPATLVLPIQVWSFAGIRVEEVCVSNALFKNSSFKNIYYVLFLFLQCQKIKVSEKWVIFLIFFLCLYLVFKAWYFCLHSEQKEGFSSFLRRVMLGCLHRILSIHSTIHGTSWSARSLERPECRAELQRWAASWPLPWKSSQSSPPMEEKHTRYKHTRGKFL